MIGRTLSNFRITAKLGEGGMGEVYRAEDVKLGREVAIKVLPEALVADEERLARFEREARVLASLNHPNIAGIHQVEEVESQHLLVLELVEGETLEERIARGPLGVENAVAIARQVTEGLEAAHRAGIVHRDLKPANIKVAPGEVVKILDFGLAKAWEGQQGSDPSLSQSPTLTAQMTQAGVILGTAAYMSPEQAKGEEADARSDVWSFGVVLWEMLTGRRLFHNETVSETLAAVLRDEVDLDTLPAETPGALRRLLGRCLDRDSRTRLQSVGEARIVLEAPGATEPSPDPTEVSEQPGAARRWVPMAVALLFGLALGWILFRGAGIPEGGARGASAAARSFVVPADGRTLDDSQAISPDGRWIAYTADDKLWIRSLDEIEARVVPDSAGARGPFWSPRSDEVAFAAAAGLFKTSVQGGRPVELCKLTGGDFTGGSWSTSEGIVFTVSRANWDGDVFRVSETGGEPQTYTVADVEAGERRLHQPHFLPDGHTLLYTVVTKTANEGDIAVERNGVRTLLDLGDGSAQPAYSTTGHVVFARTSGMKSDLWALPFSEETLTATGEAFRLAVDGGSPSFAADGTLVYGLRHPVPQQLVWVDRTGKELGVIGEPVETTIWSPALSPDGRRILTNVDWQDIAVWDVDRGVQTVVTDEAETAIWGAWRPDGEEIVYVLLNDGETLTVRRADGSGGARALWPEAGVSAPDFSADGAFLAFYVVAAETGRDLWAVALDEQGEPDEPFLLLQTPANEAFPRISPDGTLVAYQSDVSGRWELYVQPFPRGEGRWQISVNGGQFPSWSSSGDELFFVSDQDLMSVSVSKEPQVEFGTPQRLFGAADVGTRLSLHRIIEHFYDVAPDGERFVVVKGVQMGTSDLVVTQGRLLPPR